MTVLFILEFVPMYTLPPRFIMSIRELGTHDIQSGHGRGEIDSGFGLSSSPNRGGIGTRLSFAVIEDDEGIEEIPREVCIISGTE